MRDVVWPEWLTPEHSAIHTAIENEMKMALGSCISSADGAGMPWTMEGLFSIAAHNIMGFIRDYGYPPPAVGQVKALPMPNERYYDEEDTVWCTACSGDGFHQVECERCSGSGEEPSEP